MAPLALESLRLKAGVLFVRTPSGGTLMDVSADRFVALTPISALVWSAISGARPSRRALVMQIAKAKNVPEDAANRLLDRQVEIWNAAGLIDAAAPTATVPRAKPRTLAPTHAVPDEDIHRHWIAPWTALQLLAVEYRYRHVIASRGLAPALVALQATNAKPANAPDVVVRRTLRAYYALRRAFRQGQSAQDCLPRSLALAAVLRRQGVAADLCIGIIDLPFSSHAWVEERGCVLNETLHTCRDYTVIGRF